MKRIWRAVSVILILSLLLSIMPMAALADGAEKAVQTELKNPVFTKIVPHQTGKIIMTWEAVPGASQYCVHWREKGAEKELGSKTLSGTVTTYETGILPDGEYEVCIETVGSQQQVQWIPLLLTEWGGSWQPMNTNYVDGRDIIFNVNTSKEIIRYEIYLTGPDGDITKAIDSYIFGYVWIIADGILNRFSNLPDGDYYCTMLALPSGEDAEYIQTDIIRFKIGNTGAVSFYPQNGAKDVEYSIYKAPDLCVYFDRPLKVVEMSKPKVDLEKGSIRVCRTEDGQCVFEAAENPWQENTSADILCSSSDPSILIINTGGTRQLFAPDTEYYVEIDAGILQFEDGSTNAAIGREDWSFHTKALDTGLLYGEYNEYLGSERARMYLTAPRQELMDALDSSTGLETSAATMWSLSKSLDMGYWITSGIACLFRGETLSEKLVREAEDAFFQKFVLGAVDTHMDTEAAEKIVNTLKAFDFLEGKAEDKYWDVFIEANGELFTDKNGITKEELFDLIEKFDDETSKNAKKMQKFFDQFEDLGDYVTEAERAVLLGKLFATVVALSQVEVEILDDMISGLGKSRYVGSDLYDRLCEMREDVAGGDYYHTIGKFLSDEALDGLGGFVADFVELGMPSHFGITSFCLGIFGELYDLAFTSVDDIMQANIAMSYAGMLYYTLVDMQDWYHEHGIHMGAADIRQYETMVKMYHNALELGADSAENVVNSSFKYKIREVRHLIGDKETWWSNYRDICMQDLYISEFNGDQSGLTYEIRDGKAVITGAALNGRFRNKISAYTTLVVPSSIDNYPVTAIADEAFAGVSGLEHVILPESVETIGDSSFMGCTDLCYLSVPNGVKTMGDHAVAHCDSLVTVTIPESVDAVGQEAFSNCENLESLLMLGYDTELGTHLTAGSEKATLVAMNGSTGHIYAQEKGADFEEIHLAAVSLRVEKRPEKLTYLVGETFDDTGMELVVKYADGSEETLTSGWVVVCDTSEEGEVEAEILAEGCVTSVAVTVRQENKGSGGRNPAAILVPEEEKAFFDVEESDWFYEAVAYVREHGLMNGVSDGLFGPELTVTRGMIVTILHRMDGMPVAGAESFSDVSAGAYYGQAVAWAAENGIVKGVDAHTFAPDAPVTREQLAAILYRYAVYKGCDVGACEDLNKFVDMDLISSYALSALQWTVAEKLICGVGNAQLHPAGTATRAQAAAILMRFCENML